MGYEQCIDPMLSTGMPFSPMEGMVFFIIVLGVITVSIVVPHELRKWWKSSKS